ncbi:MAG TPA: hypothetical protein VGH90_10845 [Chthoniobacteraceae bacterium]|jgi:hypothetical protein
MPYRPYFTLFPAGSPVEARFLFARGEKGLPDGDYRFVEFYCDEPGCDCRRVVIQTAISEQSWKRRPIPGQRAASK